MNQRNMNMMSSLFKGVVVVAAGLAASIGAANANVIDIADNSGTITCTGSVDPACLAFAFGASSGLGTEPDGPGTLVDGNPNTEVAWYYDGTPAGDGVEATRLNTLIGANIFDASDAVKSGSPPPATFQTLAEYVLLKLGNMSVFIKNNTGGELTVTLSNLTQGFGFSHYTEFGEVDPVPIPGALWLMIAGVLGLGAAGRKKKSA